MYFKAQGLTPNKVNIDLFNHPQLQEFIKTDGAIAAELAKISTMIAAHDVAPATTVDATTAAEDDMEIEHIAAIIEASDTQLSIFLCEKEKAHSLESPSVQFDIAKATKEFRSDRSQAKARATKIKNGTKPGSRLVGGASDVANSSNAPKGKA